MFPGNWPQVYWLHNYNGDLLPLRHPHTMLPEVSKTQIENEDTGVRHS